MRSGKLRSVIYIQRKTTVANTYGEPIETWVSWKTVFAEVIPLLSQAREYFSSRSTQDVSIVPYQIKTRYIADLTVSDHRILYNGNVIEIRNVLDPDSKKRSFVILGQGVQL